MGLLAVTYSVSGDRTSVLTFKEVLQPVPPPSWGRGPGSVSPENSPSRKTAWSRALFLPTSLGIPAGSVEGLPPRGLVDGTQTVTAFVGTCRWGVGTRGIRAPRVCGWKFLKDPTGSQHSECSSLSPLACSGAATHPLGLALARVPCFSSACFPATMTNQLSHPERANLICPPGRGAGQGELQTEPQRNRSNRGKSYQTLEIGPDTVCDLPCGTMGISLPSLSWLANQWEKRIEL